MATWPAHPAHRKKAPRETRKEKARKSAVHTNRGLAFRFQPGKFRFKDGEPVKEFFFALLGLFIFAGHAHEFFLISAGGGIGHGFFKPGLRFSHFLKLGFQTLIFVLLGLKTAAEFVAQVGATALFLFVQLAPGLYLRFRCPGPSPLFSWRARRSYSAKPSRCTLMPSGLRRPISLPPLH